MIFNFKKISAIAISTLMLGMSMGVAAAANYPNPFVIGNTANVAIVYGTGEGVSALDLVQAGNIQSDLQSYMSGTSRSTSSVSGEVVELFSGGTKIYVSDSLNSVKSVLTKSDLPVILSDESFSGNVDASVTQMIDIGSTPRITFKKQPTSSDDPNYALETSTSQRDYIYNATATFSKAINFTHPDSEGEDITLFGMDFTISSTTDINALVLLKSAEKISLDSNDPTKDVTISGKTYTIELISASDSAATIKITDEEGDSNTKEINEAQSKTVSGISIAVTHADETNLKLSASVVVGSDRITLQDGDAVTIGEDDTVVDGTLVDFETGNPESLTALTISIFAPESDEDAIKVGESFVDSVYGTFKLDFSGLNIAKESTSREAISFESNGDDKMDVTFTDWRGNEETITWARSSISGLELMHNDDGRKIVVFEKQPIHYQDYVTVGNEDEGYVLRVSAVKNQTSGYSNDYVKLIDIFSGESYKTTWTSEGVGTILIGGKSYGVSLKGDSSISPEDYEVTLNYPDSNGVSVAVVYSTIETSKGAKVLFYEPINVNLANWDSLDNNLTTFRFPDGDGYTDIAVSKGDTNSSWIIGGDEIITNSSAQVTSDVGKLTYAFNSTGTADEVMVYLQTVEGENIVQPAVVVFEEKDNNNNHEALIVELEDGYSSDDGLGIDSVEDTWSSASSDWSGSMVNDSKKVLRGDLWGSIITVDSSASDQKSAIISYPDEQIYAMLYMAEESAIVTSGEGSTGIQLGEVIVKDAEVDSVNSKNLIVVGGSCINSAAASLVGGSYCGADWTEATGVGSGEFLIKGYYDSSITNKLALLVAGYNVADTVNAAMYLRTQKVDTSSEYKGTSSTSAELVTEEIITSE